MYSASIAPSWPGATLRQRAVAALLPHGRACAISIRRFAGRPAQTTAQRLAYVHGVGWTTILFWFAGCFAGLALGARLPEAWRLDFAVPVTFVALAAPLLRRAPHMAAAGAASATAVALVFLPLNLGLLAAATAGVAAGVATESALARRAAS
jgi:predicted branched-subunit amino acid permease